MAVLFDKDTELQYVFNEKLRMVLLTLFFGSKKVFE